MNLTLICSLLVGHFVADFLFQSDWMALNKSKSWKALGAHVGVYTLTLGFIVALGQPPAEYPYGAIIDFGWFLLINGIVHFVQDAITSRITSALWFLPQVGHGMRPNWIQVELRDTRHWFFVVIGVDQLLHYLVLMCTAASVLALNSRP